MENDSTQTPNPDSNPKPEANPASSADSGSAHPRRRWRRWVIGGLAATGLAAVVGAAGCGHHGPGWGHRHGWSADAGPEAMQRRLDARVRWMLADVDATEEQQRRVSEIVTTAVQDLRPLRERHLAARRTVAELFAQPTVDRGALESLRKQELALADEASRRIVQAVADAADVLTPEQRAQLAARMQRHRGWRGA